jgi:octaprenyl-diphosphate synthase
LALVDDQPGVTRDRRVGQGRLGDLEHAIGLMKKHRAIEATLERARHYGSIARDALAIFPDSVPRSALADVVSFCVNRAH